MKEDLLSKQIIGAAIEVHRELGPGLLESAYEACLCHEAQLLTYMKLTGHKLGLLLNFNAPTMKQGIKRLVLNL